MSLLYTAISNPSFKIICHRPGNDEEHRDMVNACLNEYGTMPLQDGEQCFKVRDCNIHVLVKNQFLYFAVTTADAQRGRAIQFLRQMEAEFSSDSSLLNRARHCERYQLQYDYESTLRRLMDLFPKIVVNEKVLQIQEQVNELHNIMTENVRLVLERSQHLDRLADVSGQSAVESARFVKTTVKVKRKMRCQNLKMKFWIYGVIGLVLLIIVLIILWQTGVFKSSGNSAPATQAPPAPTKKAI